MHDASGHGLLAHMGIYNTQISYVCLWVYFNFPRHPIQGSTVSREEAGVCWFSFLAWSASLAFTASGRVRISFVFVFEILRFSQVVCAPIGFLHFSKVAGAPI